MDGVFNEVDPDTVDADVGNYWRTLYKLEKTFSENPNAKKIAERVKEKVEGFKEHIPLVASMCNPGLRDRHWEQMSEIVGFPLKPDEVWDKLYPTLSMDVMCECVSVWALTFQLRLLVAARIFSDLTTCTL